MCVMKLYHKLQMNLCYCISCQMAVYKEDFENERRDKERALSEKDSLSKQTTSLLNEIKLLKERVCIPLELVGTLYPP